MRLSRDELERRIHYYNKAGYDTSKWMVFCRVMISHGFNLDIIEYNNNFVKYITVMTGDKKFKVRFGTNIVANHHADFIVGRLNNSTDDAIAATLRYFGIADDTRDSVILIEDN